MMTLRRQRISQLLLIALGAITLYLALLAFAASAHADPVTDGQISVDTAAALLEQHGPVIGGAVLLFALGGWFLRRFATAPWLTEGKRLAYASAVLMVLGSVLQWRVNGAPFEGVFTALITAWGLIMRPTVTPAPVVEPAPSPTVEVA